MSYLQLLAVRQHILDRLVVLPSASCSPLLLLLLGVQGNVARLLLDHTHDLLLGAGVENVAALAQQCL